MKEYCEPQPEQPEENYEVAEDGRLILITTNNTKVNDENTLNGDGNPIVNDDVIMMNGNFLEVTNGATEELEMESQRPEDTIILNASTMTEDQRLNETGANGVNISKSRDELVIADNKLDQSITDEHQRMATQEASGINRSHTSTDHQHGNQVENHRINDASSPSNSSKDMNQIVPGNNETIISEQNVVEKKNIKILQNIQILREETDFKGHLFWPSPITKTSSKMKKGDKAKQPAAISSEEFRRYLKRKSEEKEKLAAEKLRKREIRVKIR